MDSGYSKADEGYQKRINYLKTIAMLKVFEGNMSMQALRSEVQRDVMRSNDPLMQFYKSNDHVLMNDIDSLLHPESKALNIVEKDGKVVMGLKESFSYRSDLISDVKGSADYSKTGKF